MLTMLPARQVVVMGSPGAGKSTLAVLLTLRLLARRHDGDPVPVLLTLSSWDPQREHFDHFLVRSLGDAYPALSSGGVYGPDVALRLIARGVVVPILDGLDEMAASTHGSAIAALTRAVGRDRPLALMSRSDEYERAVSDAGGPLARALVVEIEPIAAVDAAAYLVGGRLDGVARWEPVVAHVTAHPDGVLAQVFRTPLMLYLAQSAYRSSGSDPAELLTYTEPDGVELHLLNAYVPAIYTSRPRLAGRDDDPAGDPVAYAPEQAERWLAFLADHLAREGTADLAWWRLRRDAPRFQVLYGFAGGLVGGLMGGFVGWVVGGFAGGFAAGFLRGEPQQGRIGTRRFVAPVLAAGIAITLAAGLRQTIDFSEGPASDSPDQQLLMLAAKPLVACAVGGAAGIVGGLVNRLVRWRASEPPQDMPTDKNRIIFTMTVGALFGLAVGFAHGFVNGLVYGLAFGVVYGLIGGLVGGLVGRLASWRAGGAPQQVAADPRRIALGIAAGLALGLVFGLAYGLLGGPAYGLGYGLAFGLVLGMVGSVLFGASAPAVLTEAVTPMSALANDRRASLVVGITTGLAYGIPSGIAGVRAGGIADGLLAGVGGVLGGLVAGAAFAMATGSWLMFVVTRLLLAARRRLPLNLMQFLQDAHDRGVLRQAGAVYQFRHVRLQQRLLTLHRSGHDSRPGR
ncbi:hypothetical protein [Actinoplanes sp. NPDC049118]|uniref:hypothetical protein n=1 Tax=Actinoplanes sp. NPDC049118 TaxID=3155769 RepID=UPI0033F8796D